MPTGTIKIPYSALKMSKKEILDNDALFNTSRVLQQLNINTVFYKGIKLNGSHLVFEFDYNNMGDWTTFNTAF